MRYIVQIVKHSEQFYNDAVLYDFRPPLGYSWIDFSDILTIDIFFLFKICVDGFLRSTYDDNEPMTISETSSSGSEGSLQDMADNGMSAYTMKQST